MTRRSTHDKAARIAPPKLRKKQGVWVYRADEPLSDAVVRATLRQVRRERKAQNLGKETPN